MAAAAASSRSFAAARCGVILAVLLVGCLAGAADARRLLITTAMPPAVADDMDMTMAPALAPSPESGADDGLIPGRMLFEGGLRLAGRLLIGLGL
ncbi:hypothetical protein HU200_048349 [Digitaria exilis]|uniref:Uncharacterized protein n=1 Tax=Digitaria exilis TaxID=1010633 RepID=A0A835E9F6_9POAL|nr:hypothetical protein HU200_048349 [Digitaria exilis]CAB3498560.1 unnamed protein product [Digitaria exilis]